MVGSTLNVGHFGVKQGKYHLRSTNIIHLILFCSTVVAKHTIVRLLFATELSEVISAK